MTAATDRIKLYTEARLHIRRAVAAHLAALEDTYHIEEDGRDSLTDAILYRLTHSGIGFRRRNPR